MKLSTRLRYWFARTIVKTASLNIVPAWLKTSVLDPTFKLLTREAYQKNAAVFACISALAFAIPEPPLMVWTEEGDKGEPIPKHPLRQLIRKPNPRMGEAELMIYTIVYMALGGNAYWHKVRNKAGRVIQLWPYHAGQMLPVPGGPNWIERYDYDNGTGQLQPIPADDIVHFKWPSPDPSQPWMAQPPLMAAAYEVDADNEMTRYLRALLQNDAIPRTVIKAPVGTSLTPDERKRAKEQFRENYGGNNAGDILILEDGADISRLSLNLQELAFDALHRIPESRIAAVLRVPPIIAGLLVGLERSTFANYGEARKAFTEDTLVPCWRIISSEVEADLAPEFGSDVACHHDLKRVATMQEDVNAKWARVNAASMWLTINEVRKELGYQEIDGADIFLWPANLIPQDSTDLKALIAFGPPSEPPPAAPPPSAPDNQDNPPPDPTPQDNAKSLREPETKAARSSARSLQRIRKEIAKRMESAVNSYFEDLSKTIISRVSKSWQATIETKELPDISELMSIKDDADLELIAKRYYAGIIESSWMVWNTALGVEIAFDMANPAVTAALKEAGTRVRSIGDTTRDTLKELLQYGNENGWSIDDLVNGDSDHPGIKDIIGSSQARARTIARTELGNAQQSAAVNRYEQAGVKSVLVLDNGQDDPDSACAQLNGTTQTLEWAKANPLEHPNCTRCFAPIFE